MKSNAQGTPAPGARALAAAIAIAIAVACAASLGSFLAPRAALASPYAKVQTGGYAGFVTAGLGYGAFEGAWRSEALYGYVPERVAGTPTHSLTFKTDVALPAFDAAGGRWVPAYVGGGLLWGLSRKVFARLPKEYPKKYYPSTALFWEGHLGTEYVLAGSAAAPATTPVSASAGGTGALSRAPAHSLFPYDVDVRHAVFAEANMHEMALLASYDNPGYLGPRELFTYTAGYKVIF